MGNSAACPDQGEDGIHAWARPWPMSRTHCRCRGAGPHPAWFLPHLGRLHRFQAVPWQLELEARGVSPREICTGAQETCEQVFL